jgi:hypothetical protein
MIVTSIPRSGSTKYCMDLARQLGYQYYDEIFEYYADPFAKQTIHEIHLGEMHPKTVKFIKTIDFEKSVFSNHDINFFSLERTDVFLSRKNIQDNVWAIFAYYEKYIDTFYGPVTDDKLLISVQTDLAKALYFYEYCVTCNKEIVVPDLVYTDSSIFREKYKRFKSEVLSFGRKLVVPKGLEFK